MNREYLEETAGKSCQDQGLSPKVLIVDDNPLNQMLLEETLEHLNYRLEFSDNGNSALEQVDRQEFDLIVLDIMMPGMNGFEVCRSIRARQNYDRIPILFLSALEDKTSILEGFKAGAQDFITRPFNAMDLVSKIKIHISQKLSRDQLEKNNHLLEAALTEHKHELAETRLQLEKAREELLHLDEIKLEFLHIIGHELRTTLNGISGPISLLENRQKGNGDEKLMRVLLNSAARLERFTLTALTITELKTLNQTFMEDKVYLQHLIRNTLKSFENTVQQKNLSIVFEAEPGLAFTQGNESQLKMCFKGILENAINFTPEGGMVTIRIINSGKLTICEIEDEGPGFSPTAFKNLFKLFHHGESHFDQNLGLDLCLAKMIMDAHKGSIEVNNRARGGAIVRLTFLGQCRKEGCVGECD